MTTSIMAAKRKKRPINAISPVSNTILHIIFIVFGLACTVPILIVLSVSLSTESLVVLEGYGLFPKGLTLKSYEFLLEAGAGIGVAYRNTIVSTVAGTLLCVLMTISFAYPLSRPDFRWRGQFMFYMFFTMLFTGGLVPFYMVCTSLLGLYDTMWALFLPLSFNAFWVIIMRTFYKTTIPDSLIESARIDGASEIRTWIKIVLPLSIPGIATVALFSTINIWNNFFLCMLLTESNSMQNLQYMIYSSLTNVQNLKMMIQMGYGGADLGTILQDMPDQTLRMATCIITIGPIVFAYPFFQKYFIKGLTIGAIKG